MQTHVRSFFFFSHFFLFSFLFFHTGRTFRLTVYYTRGGKNIQVFCSRNYSEVIPLRGITDSLVECRPRIDREKDEGRWNKSRYPCRGFHAFLRVQFIDINNTRMERLPRRLATIGILLCYVFRNSTFEIFQREFRFSSRCAGISKFDKRFDDKYDILLFVNCRVSQSFIFFFLRLFFFHCYYFIYATLCFNVIKKTNRATNRANCVIIWFS